MKRERYTGILFHPTSLPGSYGIGDFGKAAYKFADFLKDSHITHWQILPLGPTGYGNSPYSARSTFAGNELLISPELLLEDGLLTQEDLDTAPGFDQQKIDFQAVEQWKIPMLQKAARTFIAEASSAQKKAFDEFCSSQEYWLEDYALYTVVNTYYGDSRWYSVWDHDIGYREPEALLRWRKNYSVEILMQKVLQYFFAKQWKALKSYVNSLGILLIGDIPIFVAGDSADVWVNIHLFKTDEKGAYSAVSGVPPDFFSETGQLWGTPVYDWAENEAQQFSWWIQRVKAALTQTDIIRIDHFRGFESYWEVPAGEKTAIHGAWIQAPGAKLFQEMRKQLGEIPIIAEDLGVVTPEVEALRDDNGFPGMKIFQFGFDYVSDGILDPSNNFLPHNYPENCVAYTGTHDNDTTVGWYTSLPESHKDLVRRYLARSGEDIAWSMMRTVMASVAKYAIFPMQDLLNLGADCRMNIPSTVGSFNWSWRMLPNALQPWIADRMKEMVMLYGREPVGGTPPVGETPVEEEL